jgi:predicted metalloprotease
MVGGGVGTLIMILVFLYLGIDPTFLLNQTPTVSVPPTGATREARPAEENRLAEFVSVVLADTEDTWNDLFRQAGGEYREPILVLFTDAVESACGFADSAVGPFYCPRDEKVYIDLGFFREMRDRFRAPGDFAQAYVIAHEIGHHVQNLLGISEQVQNARARASQAEGNRLSVRLELQADCLAGVWANHADRARNIIEEGDVEEALGAASAIGDDRLQKQTRGFVVPDAFTHGSSEQRVRWFRRGLESGSSGRCNTFDAARL